MICPRCNREMIQHPDGEWVCHHTHILINDQEIKDVQSIDGTSRDSNSIEQSSS